MSDQVKTSNIVETRTATDVARSLRTYAVEQVSRAHASMEARWAAPWMFLASAALACEDISISGKTPSIEFNGYCDRVYVSKCLNEYAERLQQYPHLAMDSGHYHSIKRGVEYLNKDEYLIYNQEARTEDYVLIAASLYGFIGEREGHQGQTEATKLNNKLVGDLVHGMMRSFNYDDKIFESPAAYAQLLDYSQELYNTHRTRNGYFADLIRMGVASLMHNERIPKRGEPAVRNRESD